MKIAILVHAMQNDDIPEGSSNDMGPIARKIVQPIKRLVEAGRKNSIPVIYRRDVHYRNDPFLKAGGVPQHGEEGTPDSEIIDELKPHEDDFVIIGRRLSAFFATDLDALLRALKVDTLVTTGVVAEFGLYHTVLDAISHGYTVLYPVDCVGTRTSRKFDCVIELLSFMDNVRMTTADDIIKGFGS